jgi:citrate synthase
MNVVVASGLEGIVAADTRLSDVDGERGRLVIAGADVERLAVECSFEQVAARLLAAADPVSARTTVELEDAVAEGRVAAFALLPKLRAALSATDAMVALRGAVAQLSEVDAPALIGAVGLFVAAHARLRVGLEPIAPDPQSSHARDLLQMMRGTMPAPAETSALSAYLVTVSDHGMNASTFAARVVASTASDRISAVTAAVGALKGPLHGGAPGPVLDMLDAIGGAERAEAWVAAELQAGRRIMGMGHRVYRVRDPRAAVFEAAVQRLARSGLRGDVLERLALARTVEHEAERQLAARHPTRPLRANVEFYTAVLLEALQIDRALFTALFAAGRVAGWCAHIAEQQASGRLIRPASRYVGTQPA